MDEWDEVGALEADVAALERTLGDAARMTGAFESELQDMQRALGGASRDLGALSGGFSRGLRRAFDGVLLDGMKLSDALSGVARSMADTAYAAAINPVPSHLGGMLADGVSAAVSSLIPHANGGAFSQGRVMPFARGGVVDRATTFPMRRGTGLMGEAGPEAILPLARGADGRLGVSAGGGAAPVHVTMNVTTPDAASFQRSHSQIAAQMTRALSRAQRNR